MLVQGLITFNSLALHIMELSSNGMTKNTCKRVRDNQTAEARRQAAKARRHVVEFNFKPTEKKRLAYVHRRYQQLTLMMLQKNLPKLHEEGYLNLRAAVRRKRNNFGTNPGYFFKHRNLDAGSGGRSDGLLKDQCMEANQERVANGLR